MYPASSSRQRRQQRDEHGQRSRRRVRRSSPRILADRVVVAAPAPALPSARAVSVSPKMSFTNEEEGEVTKSELVDQVADRAELTKVQAARARRRGARHRRGRSAARQRRHALGVRQFHVAERGARQGVNPRTGERIQIAASRVPRFTAGSGLKSAVKRSLNRCPPGLRSATARRAGRSSASRRSCSGSTPTRRAVAGGRGGGGRPGRCGAAIREGARRGQRLSGCGRLSRAATGGPHPAQRAASAVLAHCRALIDAAGARVRRGQAPARVLRAARRARPGGAGGRRARTPATPGCS